jgi:hypothetical protein
MQESAQAAQITQGAENNLVSREHWLGADLGEDNQYLLRAGRMNLPFGIRSNEHTLFVRSTQVTRTNINDAQQHGIALAYNGLSFRGELMAILGNYQLNPDTFRERGYAGYLEFSLAPWVSAGVSSLLTYAKDDSLYLTQNTIRQAHGAFARVAPFKELVLLAEADALINIADDASGEALTSPGFAGMIQADYEPIQGLHLIATGETWIADQVQATSKSFAGWGSVLWFFAPHADVRFDFVAYSYGDSPVAYYLLPQLHVYL